MTDIGIQQIYLYRDLYEEVQSSIKNNIELDLNKTVYQLSSFCFSENFIHLFIFEIKKSAFLDIIAIYEMKEKFLSLKIFFQLIEELKIKKFGNILGKIKNNGEKMEKELEQYMKNNSDSIKNYEQSEKGKEALKNINNFLNKEFGKILNLGMMYLQALGYYIFSDQLWENNKPLALFKLDLKENLNMLFPSKFDKEDFELIINNMLQISSLNHTKALPQYYLFLINLAYKENEISLKEKLDTKFFKDIEDKVNIKNIKDINKINESIFWIIYEKNINSLNNNKYSKTILKGKTTKEKFYYDIFDKMNEIIFDKRIKGIKISILKSLFDNDNQILLIELDKEYLNNDKFITMEQINKNIRLIQSDIPDRYRNLNLYIQIDDTVINFIDSYNLFLEELKNRNIKEKENNINNTEFKMELNENYKKENKINIIDLKNELISQNIKLENNINNLEPNIDLIKEDIKQEKKIYFKGSNKEFNKENFRHEKQTNIIESKKELTKEKNKIRMENNDIKINELDELKSQLIKERNYNQILIEKIKKLENELKFEKNKNSILEKNIIDVQIELNNEIKKYNNLFKELEEKEKLKKKFQKENNEILLNTMVEKDKEIKELKLKLSRFPFILDEGERLMSILIDSGDQTLHASIICKNTDKFYKIESLLCEKYPKYAETENFYMVKGNKINRNKTLEQNNIKDNDVILLNTFDD